jgi:integrase
VLAGSSDQKVHRKTWPAGSDCEEKEVSGIEDYVSREVAGWSRRKKDAAPRGVFRHRSGVWAVRYACGAGCAKHEEKVGPIKTEAIRVYHQRRARALGEPGWCPVIERKALREQKRSERAKQNGRMTFSDYAEDFIAWAKINHRSWSKDDSRLSRVLPVLGGKILDEITTAGIERFLDEITRGERAVAPATRNRYRDLLSGMFKRAVRLGLVASNPVKGIPKVKEPAGRVIYLTPAEEQALHQALPRELCPLVTVALHTGMRWSEQARLRWRDADLLTGTLTLVQSKNGRARQIPMNVVVRSVLYDLGASRQRPDDPNEMIFTAAYRTTARAFEQAVQAAQGTMASAKKDGHHLDGFTWHGLRHTWASRLSMAGVDPRTIQELGGWRTLSMVERYSHLSPDHLRSAVERLVPLSAGPQPANGAPELRRNFGELGSRPGVSGRDVAEVCDSTDTEG